jgi:hypothetical protein
VKRSPRRPVMSTIRFAYALGSADRRVSTPNEPRCKTAARQDLLIGLSIRFRQAGKEALHRFHGLALFRDKDVVVG